jgi:biotin carboxylase
MPSRVMLVLPTATYRATAFLRAAAAAGVEVVVASEEAPTLEGRMVGRTLTLNLADPEESAATALAFAAQWPIDAVIGVDEASVLPAAHVAARLGVARNPLSAVAATRDKRQLRAGLTAAAVPQPVWMETRWHGEAAAADRAAASVGLPCVVKPVDLSASRGVIRADTVAELATAMERVDQLLCRPELCGATADRPLLIESFVPGAEIALEGLLSDGELAVLAIFDKPDPLNGPYFDETLYVAPSRQPEGLLAEAVTVTRAALTALGLRDGPIHAELRLSSAGAVFLEVAARSIGGRCSSAIRIHDGEADMSLEELIIRHACGMHLTAPRLAPGGAGVLMLPVPAAGVLRRISGLANAGRVPGVEAVELTIPLGQAMEPLPEGDRYLGFVTARGADAAEVETALRRAWTFLDVIVDADAGEVPV